MGGWVGRTLQARTLLTGMVALFGGASLLLACIGLYGVVSYTADLRLREFGIRMALGAGTGHVRGLVLRHAGKLALWGSALGLTLAWPPGPAPQNPPFRVTPSHPISRVMRPAAFFSVPPPLAFSLTRPQSP